MKKRCGMPPWKGCSRRASSSQTRAPILRARGPAWRRGRERQNLTSAPSKHSSAALPNAIDRLSESLGVPQLVDRLGIAVAIKSKVTILDTDAVSELVANGELELGVVVITQILTTPGLELVGPLPSEIKFYTMFVSGTSAARDLIKYLAGPVAIPVIKSQGMEPG
jgi:molybdate transport system substrate-binding protein